MILSLMIGTDEDALLCDMAEVYQIYDLESLPIMTIATLAAGLKQDSRIIQKISGIIYPPIPLLAMHIADDLTLFRYGLSSSDERPYLFLDNLEQNKEEVKGFKTAEEFENAWKRNNEGGS